MFEKIREILEFWFGSDPSNSLANQQLWWKKDPAFDAQIRERFGAVHQLAAKGELNAWMEQSQSCLAFIILLDQFSRNMYRNTPQAFAQDALALKACLYAKENKLDKDLDLIKRQFFYMPLEHSEDLDQQKLCMALMHQLKEEARAVPQYLNAMESAYDFAKQHYEIILKFGRFPHRNEILGRQSTAEELTFLQGPNSGF